MGKKAKDKRDDFFIGYLPAAPKSYVLPVRTFVLLVFIGLVALAYALVDQQRGFPPSTFELGRLSEVEGVLVMEPVPMLKVPLGEGNHQSILLIGFGKHGAGKTIREIEEAAGRQLDGETVKLRGTLIYYDGKALLELTQGKNALVEVVGEGGYLPVVKELGPLEISGEIADPKCYFGVMKPGEGKPHRSCAVRCISGGIPPVLKAINWEGGVSYFILLGPEGQAINREILDFVGEPVRLSGRAEQRDDWLFLRTDPGSEVERLFSFSVKDLPMCEEGGWAVQ